LEGMMVRTANGTPDSLTIAALRDARRALESWAWGKRLHGPDPEIVKLALQALAGAEHVVACPHMEEGRWTKD